MDKEKDKQKQVKKRKKIDVSKDVKTDEKEIKELRKKLQEKEEIEDMYLDQLKRLKAEFENYRKRVRKQLDENFKCGEKVLALDFLPVLDNLQRALDYKHIDLEGLSLIKKECFNILNRRGLKLIETEGKKFDHNFHHAAGFCEVDDDTKDEDIIEVIQPGYFWNNEVLNPAMVIVAKKKEDSEQNEKEEEKEEK